MSARIRVGIIGVNPTHGWASTTHIPALKSLPGFQLVALATAHDETAQRAGRHFKVAHAYGDYRQLIKRSDVDLVVVCVRAMKHFELVSAVIDAGKHVYCEWPLGSSTAEANELARRANIRGVRHVVGMQGRGSPVLNYARDLVISGEIGRVIGATLTVPLWIWGKPLTADESYKADIRNGVTALTITGGQALDALCFCAGELKSVSAIVAATRGSTTNVESGERIDVTAPDQVVVIGDLVDGGVANMHIKAGTGNPAGIRFEIAGSDGDILIDSILDQPPVGIHRSNLQIKIARGTTGGYRRITPPDAYVFVPPNTPPNPCFNVAQLYAHFEKTLANGEEMIPNFVTAARRRDLLDTVQRASDTGQRQTVV